jgi:hypothetical protein
MLNRFVVGERGLTGPRRQQSRPEGAKRMRERRLVSPSHDSFASGTGGSISGFVR